MKDKFKADSLKQFIDLGEIDKDSEVNRKQFLMTLTVGDEETRTITASVTTTQVDHDGDIVNPMGMDLNVFMKNPVIMWSHNYSIPPVGKAKEISVNKDGIEMKMEIAQTDMAEECWQLLKGGFLRACSVGFIARKWVIKGTKEFTEFVKEKGLSVGDTCERIITEAVLLENSLCAIPCNPSALVTAISAKSINLSAKTIKELELDKIVPVIDTPVVSEPLIAPVKDVIVPDTIIAPVKKECPICGEDDCDGECDECDNTSCPGYKLYLDSKKPKAVTQQASEVPVIPVIPAQVVVQPPVIEAPKSYLKIIRSGPVDIRAELEKEKAKRAGKIV